MKPGKTRRKAIERKGRHCDKANHRQKPPADRQRGGGDETPARFDLVSPSLFREKSQEAALTAPEGAGGSKPLLLDERCDLSADLRD